MKIFNKLFKKPRAVTFWMVDDNTVMPIACGDEKTAREVVEKEFNGEYWRIYPYTKIFRD